MLVSGLLKAYEATTNKKYENLAVELFELLRGRVQEIGFVPRLANKTLPGFLDDYAFYIEACIAIFEHTGDDDVAAHAKDFSQKAIELFGAKQGALLCYAPSLKDGAFAQKIEVQDNVIPSANSVMAINLFCLGRLFGDNKFEERAKQMLGQAKPDLIKHPLYHSNWYILAQYLESYSELVIVGDDIRNEFEKAVGLPWFKRLIIRSNLESKTPILADKHNVDATAIYFCQGKSCSLPQNHLSHIEQLNHLTASR